MHTLARRFITGATILLVAAVACERATSPASGPGAVATKLVSPNGDDGAALLEFSAGVQSVSAPAGTTAFLERLPDGAVRVLLVRETPGRFEFSLRVADRASLPTARVLDVSDAVDVPRTDVTVYRIEY
ncbi:MAG: hypothetical protein ABIW79_09195 [Gemmatimonas sp.]